jgi:hypothetical protein
MISSLFNVTLVFAMGKLQGDCQTPVLGAKGQDLITPGSESLWVNFRLSVLDILCSTSLIDRAY